MFMTLRTQQARRRPALRKAFHDGTRQLAEVLADTLGLASLAMSLILGLAVLELLLR
jgi:hypothetical protein